jgi:hypothetical protein
MNGSTDSIARQAFTWPRVLLLVGLFLFVYVGWVVGIYLILKWTGRIRGMPRKGEIAAVWAITMFVVAFFGVAIVGLLTFGLDPAERSASAAGAALGPLSLVLALVVGVGTFLLVKTYGPPRFVENPDWSGFALGAIVAMVAIGISASSYEGAAGGGTYLLAWGPALWGIYKVLRSLRRPRASHTTHPLAR